MAKDPRAIGLISISASARNRFSSFFRSARLLCLSLAAILNCITEAAVKVVVSLYTSQGKEVELHFLCMGEHQQCSNADMLT